MIDSSTRTEAEAVRERYRRRKTVVDGSRYNPLRAEVWQSIHERQGAILQLLSKHGVADCATLKLVEVGCGAGVNLLDFLRAGFSPQNLTGIELLEERAAQANKMLPAGIVHVGDAAEFNIPLASQDIVFQSVVFSSLLDDAFQHKLADAMWSWVKPGGGVLWYDFIYNNPANPDVRGVPMKRVRALFPHGQIIVRRVTLAPPIARQVCRVHAGLYRVFNAFPLLRTHVLCWIQKP